MTDASAHTTYHVAPTPAEVNETFAGSKMDTTDPFIRLMNSETTTKKIRSDVANKRCPFERIVANYYEKRVAEIKAREFEPLKMLNVRRMLQHFTGYLEARIEANWNLIKHHDDKDLGVACMNFMYRCPHLNTEEREAYMKRWDTDGDLYKLVERTTGGRAIPMPYLLTGLHPRDSILLSVLLVVKN